MNSNPFAFSPSPGVDGIVGVGPGCTNPFSNAGVSDEEWEEFQKHSKAQGVVPLIETYEESKPLDPVQDIIDAIYTDRCSGDVSPEYFTDLDYRNFLLDVGKMICQVSADKAATEDNRANRKHAVLLSHFGSKEGAKVLTEAALKAKVETDSTVMKDQAMLTAMEAELRVLTVVKEYFERGYKSYLAFGRNREEVAQ